jgi:hypothetical protein
MRSTSTRLLAAVSLAAAFAAIAAPSTQVAYPQIETVKISAIDDPRGASPDLDDGAWDEIPWQRIDAQNRLLWVRAHVALPHASSFDGVPLAVYVSALAAYDVYFNGERIGGSGVPGASAALETPGDLDTSHYLPTRLLRAGDNVLALRMSTFHLRRTLGSPTHFLAIDEYGELRRRALVGRLPVLAAAGALLLGAVYFAAMFVSDRRDRGSLLLSLLSLSVLIQLCAELARSVGYDYPLHILRLEVVHGAAIASGLALAAYVIERYAARHRRMLLAGTVVAMTAVTVLLPGFDTKTAFVILAGLLAVIVAGAIGARARLPGAAATALVAAGLVGWFATGPLSFVDETYYLAATALLLVLFAQQVAELRRVQRVRAAAEIHSTRLELELLKRQIQPHFLMNSLTAVSEWIESDPQTAVRMIEALAEEFRALAAMSGKKLVPLADELDLCRQHLTVMGYRKEQRFTLVSDGVDLSQPVPPAVVHTLIENALTHNRYTEGAVFRLASVAAPSGRRAYRLHSPVAGELSAPSSDGRGHAYVRARLQEAFGNDWAFTSGPADGEWIDAIEMPRT